MTADANTISLRLNSGFANSEAGGMWDWISLRLKFPTDDPVPDMEVAIELLLLRLPRREFLFLVCLRRMKYKAAAANRKMAANTITKIRMMPAVLFSSLPAGMTVVALVASAVVVVDNGSRLCVVGALVLVVVVVAGGRRTGGATGTVSGSSSSGGLGGAGAGAAPFCVGA